MCFFEKRACQCDELLYNAPSLTRSTQPNGAASQRSKPSQKGLENKFQKVFDTEA